MSFAIRVPVEPTTPTTPKNAGRNACTHVGVNVMHSKGYGIVADALPFEATPDGRQIIIITAGKYAKLEAATRLNRKKVAEWTKRAEEQVAARSGAVWDMVLATCAHNNLRPLPTVPANWDAIEV